LVKLLGRLGRRLLGTPLPQSFCWRRDEAKRSEAVEGNVGIFWNNIDEISLLFNFFSQPLYNKTPRTSFQDDELG
jgi:hypothetical protein